MSLEAPVSLSRRWELPFPSSPSLSFSLTSEILGFFLKLVESSAAMVWDGFAFTLRRRLVGWMYLYISFIPVSVGIPGIQASFQPFQGSVGG